MEKNQARFCKYCGTKLSEGGAFCQACGKPIDAERVIIVSEGKTKRKTSLPLAVRLVLAFFITVLVFAILIVILADTDDKDADDSSAGSTGTSTTAEPEPTPRSFPVQTNTVENWEISVTDFEFVDKVSASWISSYSPNENSKFGLVSFVITNQGTEKDIFSPLLSVSDYYLTCKIISGAYTFDSTALLGYKDDLTNKALNPLESASGVLAFSFPEDYADSESQLILTCSKNGISQIFYLR